MENEPGKLFIRTFGCQMNVYDTEKIFAFLQDRYVPALTEEDADLILLNTCSIRDKAEQKVYSLLGTLRPLKEKNPDLLVGVGGCVAQQEGERLLSKTPLVDMVFGTHNIDELPDIIEERLSTGRRICRIREDTDSVPTARAPRSTSRTGVTSFLTIMKGCDNYCAYCVVPYVRGREVSRPATDIIDEAKFLTDNGVREITLLGQNVNSYSDTATGSGFIELLERVNGLEGLERLRFVTSHPKDLSQDLVRAMASLPTVCEHLHLPVQSGSTSTLEAMKRGYSRQEYLEKVRMLRENVPGIELTTDIIVGFPGETRYHFEETLSLMEEVRYLNAFSFRFSPRPGTAAEKLADPVPAAEKKPWLPELQELQNRITSEKHQDMLGCEVDVLVEGSGRRDSGLLEGRTRSNHIVHFESTGNLPGDTVKVKISRSHRIHLEGEVSQ
jgi:tRNA-2-methylthio-N6-dimethylallyladenosine synthase